MIYPGTVLNPDKHRVEQLRRSLEKTKGHCPCVPTYLYDDSTICPCLGYRMKGDCHCGLYISDKADMPESRDTVRG